MLFVYMPVGLSPIRGNSSRLPMTRVAFLALEFDSRVRVSFSDNKKNNLTTS